VVGNRSAFCTAWFQSSSSLHSLLCRSPTDATHLGRPHASACRAPFYCTAKELQGRESVDLEEALAKRTRTRLRDPDVHYFVSSLVGHLIHVAVNSPSSSSQTVPA
jgi:hypothetical protein